MNQMKTGTRRRHWWLMPVALLLLLSITARAQVNQVTVLLGALEDAELTPDNIFNFQVQNATGQTRTATVKGTLRYRNSPLRFTYTFKAVLSAGLNTFSRDRVQSAQWNFSDNALRDLFLLYRKLPQGTYEYCVELTTQKPGGEVIPEEPVDACTYHRMDDIFLINLVEPEDGAKLYEQYPMFNWVVNYPFASMLTYKIRVAEQKEGQNPQNAITRNNAVYSEDRIAATTKTYPLTARPLEKWQPYVWTVDAYYKGILLGGAETWRFMIVEDTTKEPIPGNTSYLDISKEKGGNAVYAIGTLKLKYILEELKSDSLSLALSRDGKEIRMKSSSLRAVRGDNRYDIDLSVNAAMKHMALYEMRITSSTGVQYTVTFKYVNPAFIKQ